MHSCVLRASTFAHCSCPAHVIVCFRQPRRSLQKSAGHVAASSQATLLTQGGTRRQHQLPTQPLKQQLLATGTKGQQWAAMPLPLWGGQRNRMQQQLLRLSQLLKMLCHVAARPSPRVVLQVWHQALQVCSPLCMHSKQLNL